MSGRAAEQTVASWERQHAKINNPWPGKFPKLSEAERLRNTCERWCRCLCQDSRFMVHFTNTFGQVFFDLLGIVRGRANAGRQKAEERLVVERGEGVLRIHNTLESHWFHVGYAGFAAGDLPILGPLRVSTDGDHAISLVAAPSGETAQTKETWCLQLPHDKAEGDWWDECMNVLEELPRTEEWHMQLHRLIDVFTQPNSTSSTTRLVVLPMGKSRRWWTGVSCMEKAASEAVPDLLDESEEPEEDVEQPKDASPDRCQSDEDLPSSSVERLGSHVLPARLARACKRAAAGTRESCVACSAGGREVLTFVDIQKGQAWRESIIPDNVRLSRAGRHWQQLRQVAPSSLSQDPQGRTGYIGKRIRDDTLFASMGAAGAMFSWIASRPSRHASGGFRGREHEW